MIIHDGNLERISSIPSWDWYNDGKTTAVIDETKTDPKLIEQLYANWPFVTYKIVDNVLVEVTPGVKGDVGLKALPLEEQIKLLAEKLAIAEKDIADLKAAKIPK